MMMRNIVIERAGSEEKFPTARRALKTIKKPYTKIISQT